MESVCIATLIESLKVSIFTIFPSLSFSLTSPAALRQKLGATPSATERLQLLSPAARKLVSRATTPGSIRGTDRALRASYTPKHTPLSSSQSTPQLKGSGTTPRHKAPGSSTPGTPSLTDNLLNLKKR